MGFSGLCFFLDVHIEAQRVWVFLGAVTQCLLLALHLLVFYVRVIGLAIVLYVHVVGSCEPEWLSVPGTGMEVVVAVLVLLEADTCLE